MKSAIITGATQGIGAAIAKKLATQNFRLAICARSTQDLASIQIELRNLGSPEVYTQVCDLTHKSEAAAFGQYALEQLGRVDMLVNNAGVFIPGDICDEPDGQLEQMMQLNVYSAYTITRVVVPQMKIQESGHVFNICSVASLKAYPQGGSYSISKYALLGFSDNLREELKTSNIKVTALCPGATFSRSWQGSGVPEERIMQADDVAEVLWSAYSLSQQANVEMIVMRPQFGDL